MEFLSDEPEYPTKDEFTELDKYVDQLEKRVEGLESILGELLDLLSTEGVMEFEVQTIIKQMHKSL